MRAVEVTITVSEDGTIELEGPADLSPGKHQALLVVDEPAAPRIRREPLRLKTYPAGLVSESDTFRREDIYGDDGR